MPAVAFNEDGSRIYVKNYVISGTSGAAGQALPRSLVSRMDVRRTALKEAPYAAIRTNPAQASITTRLTLLRCEDGSTVADWEAPEVDLLLSSNVIYDASGGRVIVGASDSIYVFKADNESLELDSVVGPVPFGQDLLGIRSGRYLISYGGYFFGGSAPAHTAFYSIDLQTSNVAVLAISERVLPASNLIVYQESSGTIIVPYSTTVIIDGNTTTLRGGGTRLIDILGASTDGSIARTARVRLSDVNENALLSPSGALALVATS
jgi:hypothetical protein